jgi:hypothetical protein
VASIFRPVLNPFLSMDHVDKLMSRFASEYPASIHYFRVPSTTSESARLELVGIVLRYLYGTAARILLDELATRSESSISTSVKWDFAEKA